MPVQPNRDLAAGNWFIEAVQRGGVDLEQLAAALPREVGTLTQAPQTRDPDDMGKIFSACARQTGDPHFGLHMVQFAPLATMGIYGYLLLNAPTVGELLAIAEKYFSTFFLGASFRATYGAHRCKLSLQRTGPASVSLRHGNEWALGVMVHLIRARLGHQWHPGRTRFANEAPGSLDELHTVFGENVSFGEPQSSIEFSRAILDSAIPDADPNLLRILMAHGDELLKRARPHQNLESQLRLLVFENLGREDTGESFVAGKLNMSVSTLKRRLADIGLSYRTLHRDVIMELARTALRDTTTPVGTIALKLGYSDASAFTRAFRHAQGVSPRAFRNRLQPSSSE